MALIAPEFFSGPVLIVGDGNFSFSACLAQSKLDFRHEIFATSLDKIEELQENPLAKQNLAKLDQHSSFTVIHGVDATNLQQTFKDQIFDKIVFNFPHTGGKLKISKCRNLLEKFFCSAKKLINSTSGVVCVSLCQGQGGTPQDSVQRDYGNTWQVVNQSAKAGLILNTVHPFRDVDYPGYCSAGFKGRINQGFTTQNGLTYFFIVGVPPIPDNIGTFSKEKISPANSPNTLFHIESHPLNGIKEKLEQTFKARGFELTSGESDVDFLSKNFENSLKIEESLKDYNMSSLCYQTYQLIKKNDLLVVSGCEYNPSIPVNAGFHPISHFTVVTKSYDRETSNKETIIHELEEAVHNCIDNICNGVSCTKEMTNFDGNHELNFSKRHLNLFKPVDYQRLRNRERRFHEWRPEKVFLFTDNEDEMISSNQNCYISQMEEKYFSEDDIVRVEDIIMKSTVQKVFSDDKLLFTYGLIKQEISGNHRSILLAHLDNLTMVLCGIKDVRMLWSKNKHFLEQYQGKSKETLPIFTPFSLFPHIFIHDISFWLTNDSTENKLFQAIHKVTGNLVSDVWFRERYVDTSKRQISYNYRLVYCRCDGPLSHLDTVNLQNQLRLLLLSMNFKLS